MSESWQTKHTTQILNLDDQLKWFDRIQSSKTDLVLMAYCSTDKPIGIFKLWNINWINRSYDSSHDVFPNCRGKGHGSNLLIAGVDFGFEILDMHRVTTEVLATNTPSLKTILGAGFTEEGIKRKVVKRNGVWIDSIVLGLLREDWEKLERRKDEKDSSVQKEAADNSSRQEVVVKGPWRSWKPPDLVG